MQSEPTAGSAASAEPVTITASDIGLLLIRVLPAVAFTLHGMQKLFGAFGGPGLQGFTGYLASMGVPSAPLAAILAAGVEFVGGLALLTGIGTRSLAILLFFDMAVACMLVHRHAFFLQNGGMEYALTLALTMLGIALLGPGQITIPGAIRTVRNRRG